MKSCCLKRVKSLFQKRDPSGKLNLFTLSSDCPDLQSQIDAHRFKNFNRLIWPSALVMLLVRFPQIFISYGHHQQLDYVLFFYCLLGLVFLMLWYKVIQQQSPAIRKYAPTVILFFLMHSGMIAQVIQMTLARTGCCNAQETKVGFMSYPSPFILPKLAMLCCLFLCSPFWPLAINSTLVIFKQLASGLILNSWQETIFWASEGGECSPIVCIEFLIVLFWALLLSYQNDLDACKSKIDTYQAQKSHTELTDFFNKQNEAIILKTEAQPESDADEVLFVNDSVQSILGFKISKGSAQAQLCLD